MRRNLFISLFIIIVILLVVALIFFPTRKNAPSQTETSHTLSQGQTLLMSGERGLFLIESKKKKYEFDVEDIETIYSLDEDSTLKIVERILPNKDQFIFLEWMDDENDNNPIEDRDIEYSEKINFTLLIDDTNQYDIQSFSVLDVERPHDNTVGIDEVTYPNGLFTFKEYDEHMADVMLGKNYVSKKLTKQYEDGNESFIRQLMEERSSYNIYQTNNISELSFDMFFNQGLISEQWLMLSDSSLFENLEELSDFILFSNEQYRGFNSWYTAKGIFSKLPWSVEPFVEEGYGRNLNYYREDSVLKRYRDGNPERYYHNLLVNSITYYENHEKDDNGLFETHYTSTWLKNDYGTTAPYIDSRHNELGAIYINTITRDLELPYAQDPRINYADFMLIQKDLNNIIEVSNDAYFIADYYDPSEHAELTHVSLNHVLGIMNLLLHTHIATEDKKYLNVATKIHNALMETRDQWIRDDNDLWYQVDNNFDFDGRDYPIVTLLDLIDAEILWQRVNNDKRQLYNDFIVSKIKYLTEENIQLEEAILYKLEEAHYDLEKLLKN